MGRLGFGPGRFRARGWGSAPAPAPQPQLASISPSDAWTGIAASGFAVAPSDPARITAKPAMRMIVPPNQAYDDELVVGVYAGANSGGSLIDNMGLEKVTAHYEGAVVDIAAPSLRKFDDVNGNPVTYFGWWVTLKRDGRDGFADLYFEAVPKDATMQRRVIGPYTFLPRAQSSIYSHSLTIAPSQPVIAGSRYPTLLAALNYLYGQASLDNALLTIVEPGTYAFGINNFARNLGTGKGRVTIAASVPVTISNPPWATASTSSTVGLSQFFPRVEPLCLRGENITVDFQWATAFTLASNDLSWFDGVNFTVSGGDRSLLFKQLRGSNGKSFPARAHWFTECRFENLPVPVVGQSLVRGCTFTRCYRDLVNSVGLLTDSTFSETDNRYWTDPLDAMTLTYVGAGATATVQASGTQGTTKTFTFKVDGEAVGTYALKFALATYDTGANYEVHHLVDYVNTLPGWSATLIDDTRAGVGLSHATASVPGDGFAEVDAKGVTVTLSIRHDLHADFAQTYSLENFIIANCSARDINGQMIFFKDGPVKDGLVLNNAFSTPEDVVLSQFADLHSHIVVAHNSWSQQGFMWRTDLVGATPSARYDPDTYCLHANNVGATLLWGGAADADLTIADNHLFGGALIPAGSTGTTTGGAGADLFADAAAGNFTPQGDLLTNLKPPVIRYDASHKRRGSAAPAGAFA